MNKRSWFLGLLIVGLACCGWGMVQVETTGEFVKGAKSARARVTYLDVRVDSPDQKIESWHQADRYSRSVYRTVTFTTHRGRVPGTSSGGMGKRTAGDVQVTTGLPFSSSFT